MGVKLGLQTLRDERRLREFENRVLRKIFGSKKEWSRENFILRSFMICTPPRNCGGEKINKN
jgi:hypothetical protein